jgi:hypothetical protein
MRNNFSKQFEILYNIYIFVFLLNLGILWIQSQYFSINIFDILSFKGDDRPGNLSWESLFGQHFFGDFALPLAWAMEKSYWINSITPLSSYPPVAMYVFELFSKLPINLSLALYLFLTIASIAYPALEIYFKKSKQVGFQFLIISFLSIGTIATLDRGNIIGLLVTPFYLMLRSDNQKVRLFWLYIISSIKIYPILLILIEVKMRNLKKYFLLLIPFGIINFIIIFIQENSLKQNVQTLIYSFSAYRGVYDNSSLSFVSSARNLIRFSSEILGFNPSTFTEVITRNSISISFIILIVYLFFLRFCKSESIEYKYLFGTMTLWLIIPTTFVYTTVLIIPVCAIIVYNNLRKNNQSENQLQSTYWENNSFREKVLLFAILITLMPTIWLYDDINLKFMFQNILWIISLISFLIYQLRVNIELKYSKNTNREISN